MSISTALSNALSGLTASSKNANVVSANLANILTPGYAPRSLELAALSDIRGGGVAVVGVSRQVDENLVSDRRLADGELSYFDTKSAFATDLETVVGAPEQVSSLLGQLAALEASLVVAASIPEDESRLQASVLRAGEVANKLNDISDHIEKVRTETEGQIAQAVDSVNTLLQQVRSLNIEIVKATNNDHPTASLEDQRRTAIDQLAEFIPLRLMRRDNGAVAMYSQGGALLLDGGAARLGFSAVNVVTAHMTLQNGLLSGLSINDIAVVPSGVTSSIDGGRLAALFEIRDALAVDAQTQVDAVARDLVERFQQPGLDASRAAGDPGLFTDGGTAFAAADETGLSGRVSVNVLVDPTQGGAVWRLRDGLGAATPGPVGNATLLQQLQGALTKKGVMASGDLGGAMRSVAGHATGLISRVSLQRLTIEQSVAFASARRAGLAEMELGQGVDSDAEMQKLLLIEQAYNANARMIQVVDDLMETLLRI